jgi:2-keto-3-deoxy-L-rhamnonate aldolase RhmA
VLQPQRLDEVDRGALLAVIDGAIGRILAAGKAPGILAVDETLARTARALAARVKLVTR